jgi:putative transposase
MLKVIHDETDANATGDVATGSPDSSLLDEIVRDGARQMLAAALQAEVAAYVEAHVHEVDEVGRRPVVRNGYRDSSRTHRPEIGAA